MNPLLSRLQPYPFERLRLLVKDVVANPALRHISLGIGEPKHPAPHLIEEALVGNLKALSGYPATGGEPALRLAITGWLKRRYGLELDSASQVLPVNGSREALFALAQTVIDPTRPRPIVISPNPFYQIYEGAALLAGADVVFINSDARGLNADWASIDEATWATTQLVYVCSPGNPTGAVMQMEEWRQLFELSDRHGFVIASDECYSEIYFRDEPPLGSLEAATKLGRTDFRNLVAFTSLSKRSNVPGMRSGFVAGDAAILKQFLLYRTYHGSAMSGMIQHASIAGWNDEQHVVDNRTKYRQKFAQVVPVLGEVLDVALPDAGFYLWIRVPGGDDQGFAKALLAQYNVGVLPGSFLAREAHGINPGQGRIRLALVAEVDECLEAAHRIASFVKGPSERQRQRQPPALMTTASYAALQSTIEQAWEARTSLSSQSAPAEVRDAVDSVIGALDAGTLRVAERQGVGQWNVNQWVKKAVLLSFRLNDNEIMTSGDLGFFDKVKTKFSGASAAEMQATGVRVVPPAVARRGSFMAKNVILMPSYVNIGAYVDEGTMVDTWATVGSCAQIGKGVHLSGGVGIGGVLEPLQANPTIIEDNCFIGARSEIVEGVIVEENSVISMGVYIGQSTKIYDRATGEVSYGRVPAGSVVVSGNLPSADGKYSLYCAVIVKRVDAQTRSKTSINELLRD